MAVHPDLRLRRTKALLQKPISMATLRHGSRPRRARRRPARARLAPWRKNSSPSETFARPPPL